MMLTVVVAVILGIFGTTDSAPQGEPQPSFLTFDKGKIGVNFLGFHASAGLGGFLTGNSADGGLYAEAGTPFGQAAHAGLGGYADNQGRRAGNMFAGATAGNGVYAAAGLGSEPGESGAVANAGNRGIVVSKAPASYGAGFSRFVSGQLDSVPEKETNVQVVHQKNAKVKKTHLRKVGNEENVEKSISLVSEVPVPEKRFEAAPVFDLDVRGDLYAAVPPLPPPSPPSTVYIEKTKFKARRRPHLRKHVVITKTGYDALEAPPPPPVFGPPSGEVGVYGTKTVTLRKSVNVPQIINDSFNIPIQTLKAVSQLVGGLARNVEGSVSASKSVSVNVEASKHIN